MEQIKTVLPTEINRQPQVSSQTAPIGKISIEKQTAMGDVIDRWRLNLGWRPLDNDSQNLAIQSWVHVLDSEKVPAAAYNELFDRALKLRALMISQNKSVPDFGVELLLACWDGEHGLRRELRQREIDRGRTLTHHAQSQCPHCHNSGFREVKQGDYKGTIRCNHED